jgi:hypothetical protein
VSHLERCAVVHGSSTDDGGSGRRTC